MKRILTSLLWAFIILVIDTACFFCTVYICEFLHSRRDFDVLDVEYFQITTNNEATVCDSTGTDGNSVFLKVVSGKDKSLFMVSQSFQYLRNATNYDNIDKNNVIVREVDNKTESMEISDGNIRIAFDCCKTWSEWLVFTCCDSKRIRLQPLYDMYEHKRYGDI